MAETTATTESTADWLRRLCFPDISRNAWGRRPFHVGVADGYYTVATNGKVLVAVPGLLGDFTTAEEGSDRAEPFLRHVRDWHETLPMAWLREWAGPAVFTVPCPKCRGTSATAEEVYCSFCDGDGDMIPDARRGWLMGRLLDRVMVGQAIAGVEAETVRLHWSSRPGSDGGKTETATFEPAGPGPRWRAVVACMNVVPEAIEKDPPAPFGAGKIDPAWLSPDVMTLARGAPPAVLAGALEERGCCDAVLLGHLRNPHAGPCWVGDLIGRAVAP